MKRIEIKLSVPVVAPLLDVIRAMAEGLKQTLAVPLEMEDLDEDLLVTWVDDLLAAQRGDLDTLLALFNEEFFRDGAIVLDEENAELVVRACAAVRLRLRSQELTNVEEELLESGDVAINELPESQRRAFMCYLFLATMQELIIQHLDLSPPES